ncbi:hypothetical protein N7475_003547 [Penicillium sp. IBT 31633x]|nr:hypothetical protein N7475_003547 [Penicillium sp. IBT 31633x]
MLAERERLIHNEEEDTGRPATWDLVYGLMRCDVRSCPLKSQWCWEDPQDKKHYKMRAPHLERLIDYVDGGGSLDSHDDVPSGILRDLVAPVCPQEHQSVPRGSFTFFAPTGLNL